MHQKAQEPRPVPYGAGLAPQTNMHTMRRMKAKTLRRWAGYTIASICAGGSIGLIIFLITPHTETPHIIQEPFQEEISKTPEPEPTLFPFIEIVRSCNHASIGVCASVYTAPSIHAPTSGTLRTGVVLKVSDMFMEENELWYRVTFDEWIRYPHRIDGTWYVRGVDARLFFDEGQTAQSTDTKVTQKRIVVDRSAQTLSAYNNDELFMHITISTGLLLTPTPRGTFTIFKKTPSRYMQGPLPGISTQYYDLPGVPWTLYFTEQGGAIHGAYWHNNFGRPWSHGCVNVPLKDAETLYRWADIGTIVIVHD